jgi:large subunit ribosomal protein L31
MAKKGIHPKLKLITVSCSCGSKFQTMSTKDSDYSIEICSACHPFYSGKQKISDTAGRIEKFNQRYKRAAYAEKK